MYKLQNIEAKGVVLRGNAQFSAHISSIHLLFQMVESGVDVKFNHRLEGLIDKAKSISMPKEKIESAIKSGAGVSFFLFVYLFIYLFFASDGHV